MTRGWPYIPLLYGYHRDPVTFEQLKHTFVLVILTLYGRIKSAEQRTVTNTVIGTLAVDGWAVTFGAARTAQLYQLHIILCGSCLCTLNGS